MKDRLLVFIDLIDGILSSGLLLASYFIINIMWGEIVYEKDTLLYFCNQDSTESKSVEHIIPESLGNDELILDKGIVCDKCNNYFSREIENPVLNLDGFKQLRFYELIKSKRGRIPNSDAFFVGKSVTFTGNRLMVKTV